MPNEPPTSGEMTRILSSGMSNNLANSPCKANGLCALVVRHNFPSWSTEPSALRISMGQAVTFDTSKSNRTTVVAAANAASTACLSPTWCKAAILSGDSGQTSGPFRSLIVNATEASVSYATSTSSIASMAAWRVFPTTMQMGSPKCLITELFNSGRGLSTPAKPSSRTGAPVHTISATPSWAASSAVSTATTSGAARAISTDK